MRKQLERQSRSDYDGYRRLAYLLRAKGDAAAAVAAAERTSDGTFVDNLMVEAGQWAAVARMKAKAMAEDPPDDDPSRHISELCQLAAFQQLAGQNAAFEKSAAEIVTLCRQHPEQSWSGAKTLLMAGRCDDGIDLWSQHNNGAGFPLLCWQHRYREAFRRAGLADLSQTRPNWHRVLKLELPNEAQLNFWTGCGMARTLHSLGEKEKARDLLATLAAAATDEKNKKHPSPQPAVELRKGRGLVRRGHETCRDVLGSQPDPNRQADSPKCSPNNSTLPTSCGKRSAQEYPAEKEADSLGRLQRLLAAGDPPAGWDDEIRKLAARRNTNQANQPCQQGIAPTALPYHQVGITASLPFWRSRRSANIAGVITWRSTYAEKVAPASLSADNLVKLGDIFAAEKRWDRAAHSL